MNKRGQAWGFDLLIASSVFFLAIAIFFVYTLNSSKDYEQKLEDLLYEGNSMAEDLMSEGFPADWNIDNVKTIGLLNESKIDKEKLENFYTLSTSDYRKTKALFDIKYDYFMNFTEPIIIESEQIEGIGIKPVTPKNLVKISRFTIFNNKPTTLNLYIWE